jgi:hypothetical protein
MESTRGLGIPNHNVVGTQELSYETHRNIIEQSFWAVLS